MLKEIKKQNIFVRILFVYCTFLLIKKISFDYFGIEIGV